MPTLPYTSTPANASGRAVASIRASGMRHWNITQVSVELPLAPVGATCSIRRNGRLVSPIIPTGDVASGEPPVPLGPGDEMTVEWAGCTPGQVGSGLVIYDEVR